MSSYIRTGAQAPAAYVLNLTPETAGVDLSTVTAASLSVRKPDGTTTSWSATRSNQTTTTLTLTHLFDVADLTKAGQYVIHALLTLPAGTLPSEPVILLVKNEYEV